MRRQSSEEIDCNEKILCGLGGVGLIGIFAPKTGFSEARTRADLALEGLAKAADGGKVGTLERRSGKKE
jgi:hypothetical protein